MSPPLFSVIVPTYHRNDLLSKCLDCLAPGYQTWSAENYEVIVTDDGYKTTAEEMIHEKYPWAIWVAGPRKGPAANRNNGANYAQGDWLAFTDDDCLPDSQWLEAYERAIIPDFQVYEGKTTCEIGLRSPLDHSPINLTGGYLWSCNMMVKATIFWNIGGFDEGFPYPHMEDAALREEIILAGYSFLFVENAIVDHPPKQMHLGDPIAKLHESYLYYWQHKRGEKVSRLKLLCNILTYRLRIISQYSLCFESFKAIVMLIWEILYVAYQFNTWSKKYEI